MILPNLFIIGASKAGSTSLHHYIGQHPDIYMSKNKEPAFFQKDENYHKGLEWYWTEFFSDVNNELVVGESSAAYLYYSKVAQRLSELPKLNQRFIVTLRNPVERAFSQYWHQVRSGEYRTFSQAIKEEVEILKSNPHSIFQFPPVSYYLGRGMYAKHLQNYFKHFDRSQFLIVFFEDLKNSCQETMDKIFKLVGVNSHIIFPDKIHNFQNTDRKLLLVNKIKRLPYYQNFKYFINKSLRKKIYHNIRKGLMTNKLGNSMQMDLETKKFLMEYFAEDMKELKMLLKGTKNPDWLLNFEYSDYE